MKINPYNSEVFQEVKKHVNIHFPLIFEQLLTLAIVLFLIYYRSPNLFFEPRFWAEEGQGYFAFAFSHSIMESLFAPHYGYFNLIPNVGGILATFAPLELAPLVTTCLAALIQLLVSSYVIFCDSPYWDTFPQKIAIACFIQILCPAECWLTTISSQYFLSIIAFFILVETDLAQKSWLKWPSRIVLSVSVLTSPVVTFLLPAFVFKSLRTRSREDWLRAGIISFGAFVQAIAFLHICLTASSQLKDRFQAEGLNLSHLLFLHLSESMFGTYYLCIFNLFGLNVRFLGMVLMAFEFYLLYLLIKCFFCKQLQLHAIAFILLTVPAILLSLGMYSSPRAAFAPAIILTVLMAYEYGNIRNRLILRRIALCALSAVMLFGLSVHDMKGYNNDYIPAWKDEVMLWRQDSNHLLAIWPAPWNMKLEQKKE